MELVHPHSVAFYDRERLATQIPAYLAGALAIACVASLDASYRVRESTNTSLDWQVAMRLGVCAACGLFGIVNLERTVRFFWRSPVIWMTVFAIWVLVTVPLSLEPRAALAAVGTHWCMFLFVPAALDRVGPRRLAMILLISLLALLAASLYVHFLVPSLGRRAFLAEDAASVHRLGGLSHPNATARLAVLAMGLLLCLRGAGQLGRTTVVAVAMFLTLILLLAAGRTAALSCMVIVPFLVIPRKYFLGFGLLAVSAASIATMLFASGAIELDSFLARYVSRSDSAESVYELQGRAELWSHVVKFVARSPIVGTGYGCQRSATLESRHWSVGKHSHNLWLNTLLGSGFVGIGCLTIAFLILIRKAFTQPEPVPDFILLFLLIHGLTSSPVLNQLPGTPTMLLFVALFWRPMQLSLCDEPNQGSLAA